MWRAADGPGRRLRQIRRKRRKEGLTRFSEWEVPVGLKIVLEGVNEQVSWIRGHCPLE